MRRKKTPRPRTPLQRKKTLKAKKPLDPGKPLERKTGMKRGGSLKRTGALRAKPRVKLFDDREMRLAWIKHVRAEAPRDKGGFIVCPVCGKRPTRHNSIQGHHVVEQQYLRKHVRAMKLSAEEASRTLASLLWDVRNGLPVCTSCHDLHTRRIKLIPFRLISRKAHQFAREVLADYTLDRYYDRDAK